MEAYKVVRLRDGIMAMFEEEVSLQDSETVKIDVSERGIFLSVGADKRVFLNPGLIQFLKENPRVYFLYSPRDFYDFSSWRGVVEVDQEVMDKLVFALEMVSIEGIEGEESSSPENKNGPASGKGNENDSERNPDEHTENGDSSQNDK